METCDPSRIDKIAAMAGISKEIAVSLIDQGILEMACSYDHCCDFIEEKIQSFSLGVSARNAKAQIEQMAANLEFVTYPIERFGPIPCPTSNEPVVGVTCDGTEKVKKTFPKLSARKANELVKGLTQPMTGRAARRNRRKRNRG